MTPSDNRSDLLRHLISSDAIRAHPDQTLVTGQDLDTLKSILTKKSAPDFPVNTKRAVEVLARSDGSAGTAGILTGLLADAANPIELRVTAATQLQRLPRKSAERPLIEALKTEDPRLSRAVLGSLSVVGGRAALKAISELPETREVASARLLIGVREGVHKGGFADALGTGFTVVTSKPVSSKDARLLLEAIGGSASGVSLDPEGAVAFSCRDARHAVFLARNVDLDATGVAGAVVRYDGTSDSATLRYLVLVAVRKDGLDIALTTPTGRADYVGHGKTTRTTTVFQVRETGSAAVPLTAEAKVVGGKVTLTLEIADFSGDTARRTRAPQPIQTAARGGVR